MTVYELTYVLAIVVLLYRAASNLVIFFRYKRLEFLAWFALTQASFALYLFCLLKTINTSPESALFWERIENAVLPLMAAVFLQFTQKFRPVFPEWAVWTFTGLDVLLSIVILFYPHAYVAALSAPKSFPVLGITIFETVQPVWVMIFIFSNLLLMCAIVILYMRLGIFGHRHFRLVLSALILFFLMGASDMAVALHFYEMPYIAHFGFLLVMVSVESLFQVNVRVPHLEEEREISQGLSQGPDSSPGPGTTDAGATPAGAGVLIRVLGKFGVEGPGGEELYREIIRKPKMFKLMKTLLLDPDRGVHREAVLESLWPGQKPAAASNNLHALVFRLRKLSGDADFIEVSEERVRLKPGLRVDSALFEASLSKAEALLRKQDHPALALEECASLYRGGYFDFDPYFAGAEDRREHLAQRYRRCLVQAASLAVHSPERALEFSERALSLDRSDEAAARLLMRSLALLGRRGEALKRFDELKKHLRSELDVDPDPETARLAAEIRSSQ